MIQISRQMEFRRSCLEGALKRCWEKKQKKKHTDCKEYNVKSDIHWPEFPLVPIVRQKLLQYKYLPVTSHCNIIILLKCGPNGPNGRKPSDLGPSIIRQDADRCG